MSTTDTLITSSWDHAKALGADGLDVFKRLTTAHKEMVDAAVAVRLSDPEDPRHPVLLGNVAVKRGLFREAVEIEMKDFGAEVVSAALAVLVELVS